MGVGLGRRPIRRRSRKVRLRQGKGGARVVPKSERQCSLWLARQLRERFQLFDAGGEQLRLSARANERQRSLDALGI